MRIFQAIDPVVGLVEYDAKGDVIESIEVSPFYIEPNPAKKFSRKYAGYDDNDYETPEDQDAYVPDKLAAIGTVTLDEYKAGKRVPFLSGDRTTYRPRNEIARTEDGVPVVVFKSKDGTAYVRHLSWSVTVWEAADVTHSVCRCGWKSASQERVTTMKWLLLHLAQHSATR